MADSFRTRLAILLLGLVALVQVSTFAAVYYTTRQNAIGQATSHLQMGGAVFSRLMQQRGAQLLDAVQVITSDFAFKQAVATGDKPTIHSVLVNHGGRISADVAILSRLDGRIVTATGVDSAVLESDWAGLLRRARNARQFSTIALLDGKPFQLVIVPVDAPTRIAWVGMGFALDGALALQLKSLTHLEVTFAARSTAGKASVLRSTLPPQRQRELARALVGPAAYANGMLSMDGEEYLTERRVLRRGSGSMLTAILQNSMVQALAPYRALKQQLALIAVLSLGASLLGALLLARGVTKPLRLLAGAARRIERGDYMERVEIDRRDELGALAKAFNRMQGGIAKREQQIAHQAFHDSLTGLPNRAHLRERLTRAIAHAREQHFTDGIALLMVDIDRFKEINDTLGHEIGDHVLMELGRRLSETVNGTNMVARLGGDEYVVLLECTDRARAVASAERIASAATAPMRLQSMDMYLDISIGIALYPEHGEDSEDLLRRADIAMYDAKQAGQPLCVYEPGRDASHLHRLALANDLRQAIPNDELRVHYQPKLGLKDKRVRHLEALVRWQHPVHGMVPPDEFIPLAEHSGSIRHLTQWVLESVIQQIRRWQHAGLDVQVAVNLSALDLGSGDLPDIVQGLLNHYAVAADRLVLEITESAVMRDALYSLEILNRLKACGVRLAIDDFGTGYSSLAHLKRLPVDELKIDRSFVMGMDSDEDDAVIVRSTIELGHNMGLSVVAEGVESLDTLELLDGFHCDMVQGYAIGRPMPAAEVDAWLRQYRAPAGTVTNRLHAI